MAWKLNASSIPDLDNILKFPHSDCTVMSSKRLQVQELQLAIIITSDV